MEKNELYRLLTQKEKECEKAKFRRMIITILVFSAVFFVVFYFADHPTGVDIICTALVSIFIAGIHFYVNALVFSTLFSKSEAEKKMLESIKKDISEIEEQ